MSAFIPGKIAHHGSPDEAQEASVLTKRHLRRCQARRQRDQARKRDAPPGPPRQARVSEHKSHATARVTMTVGQGKMQLTYGCQIRSWHLELAWAAALAAAGGSCTFLVCLYAGGSLWLHSPLNAAEAG